MAEIELMNEIELVHKVPSYEIAEEVKQLRSNLLFCGDDKRVIMVTSCISGEGKSNTTLLLAKSLVEMGKSVLLIDCDLRKSVLDKQVVNGKIGIGLSHYLSGQSKIESVIYQEKFSDLNLIPAGKTPPNPVELLLNPRFTQLIEYARRHYDYVVLDCPPLGMVSDATAVAPSCDGALFLISAGGVSYKFALKVKEQLEKTGCPLLGVVLNKVDYKAESAYGRYGRYGKYGKYYGHYQKYGN